MPDGKVMLILVAAAVLTAGAHRAAVGVKDAGVATKNVAVKMFHHIHPKGAAKAVVNHQK